jgi:hypothetical protein
VEAGLADLEEKVAMSAGLKETTMTIQTGESAAKEKGMLAEADLAPSAEFWQKCDKAENSMGNPWELTASPENTK